LPVRRFRIIKPEVRILGVDDGVFPPHTKGFAPVIGVVFRGGYWLEGVMSTRIEIDGFDSTVKIASMITRSQHHKQLRVIMLDGVTFGGFNVVDMKRLSELTELPVIAITRDKPDFREIHEALKNLSRSTERWRAVQSAGKIFEVQTRNMNEKVFMETSRIHEQDARKIVQLTATRSSIPEPLRVAHLVASGLDQP
jgi:endonuclease V-like protein UPF0215 family